MELNIEKVMRVLSDLTVYEEKKATVTNKEFRLFQELLLSEDEEDLLIKQYLFEDKYQKDLVKRILEVKDGEYLKNTLEFLVEIYPLSKKILDAVTDRMDDDYIDIIVQKYSNSNMYLEGISNYFSNLHEEYKSRESIEELQKYEKKIEDEIREINRLREESKKLDAKRKEYAKKIEEKKSLGIEINELKKSLQDHEKEIRKAKKDLEVLKIQKEKRKAELQNIAQQKETLKKALSELDKDYMNKEEQKLIESLMKLWPDNHE